MPSTNEQSSLVAAQSQVRKLIQMNRLERIFDPLGPFIGMSPEEEDLRSCAKISPPQASLSLLGCMEA